MFSENEIPQQKAWGEEFSFYKIGSNMKTPEEAMSRILSYCGSSAGNFPIINDQLENIDLEGKSFIDGEFNKGWGSWYFINKMSTSSNGDHKSGSVIVLNSISIGEYLDKNPLSSNDTVVQVDWNKNENGFNGEIVVFTNTYPKN